MSSRSRSFISFQNAPFRKVSLPKAVDLKERYYSVQQSQSRVTADIVIPELFFHFCLSPLFSAAMSLRPFNPFAELTFWRPFLGKGKSAPERRRRKKSREGRKSLKAKSYGTLYLVERERYSTMKKCWRKRKRCFETVQFSRGVIFQSPMGAKRSTTSSEYTRRQGR